ncbi:acyl-CoA synthetase [Deinococcus radiophilus]|uniref:AMP-dependent synthetase n=1 Tax=Deinococcus radiophilus TaxID=32062 RepID=A0A3S0L8F7_9DEIO|nr:AMP-binding protein [Deinococcus radiophilus]RTR29389.1 AMP-dependent synthetase [Deinococcus radiophilus]
MTTYHSPTDPSQALKQVQNWLEQYGGTEVDVAELLCDRWAREPGRKALNYENGFGYHEGLSYRDLEERSRRFAAALRQMGVGQGDRVAILLPKRPALLIAAIALWRLGAVYVPLFTAFGPDAVRVRIEDARARIVITDAANDPKLAGIGGIHVIRVESDSDEEELGPDQGFHASIAAHDPLTENVRISGEDLMILLYTSGTTGQPKGVPIRVKALAAFEAYMRFALDVRDDDVFWNMADPGWAYGLYYGIVGPLLLGKTLLFYRAPFQAEKALDVMRRYGVTNFAAAPTAYRVMRSAGLPRPEGLQLRVASSAGEPLNPELFRWAKEFLDVPLFDHWGQTELGMAIVNHHADGLRREVKPGSMGQTMPGFRAAVLDEQGREVSPGVEGELALVLADSPLCIFSEYYQAPDRTLERIDEQGQYYRTGDTASYDEDGYYFFSGRGDDIILSAGYRIGPFEVESALVSHPDVAEAAVVGKPDELRGELVKAYVVLKDGKSGNDDLADELSSYVKTKLAAHAYPREIVFMEALPKTPSGKVQRFLLRAES